jgi:hypothetical protein
VAAYWATVEARLQQAETAAAETLVRKAEQRKRRRLAIAAGSSMAAGLLVGLGVSLWQIQRAVIATGQAQDNEAKAVANAELAQVNEPKAISEHDAKDAALKAEEIARQQAVQAAEKEKAARLAEKEARDRAMAVLRVMTDELVEQQLARSPALTEENKAFLRKVIEHF